MKFDFFSFLDDIGLMWKYLINGLIGGAVWSIYKKLSFLAALRQMVIGMFIAGYLTPLIGFKEGIPVQLISGLSFIVGMGGMAIVEALLESYKKVKRGRYLANKEIVNKESE